MQRPARKVPNYQFRFSKVVEDSLWHLLNIKNCVPRPRKEKKAKLEKEKQKMISFGSSQALNETDPIRNRRSFFVPSSTGFNSIFDAYKNGTKRSRADFEALFVQDFKTLLKNSQLNHIRLSDRRSNRIQRKEMRSSKLGEILFNYFMSLF